MEYASDKIIFFHEKNNMILVLYNEVSKFTLEYLSLEYLSTNNNSHNICGNMIMQYFLYDPLIVGGDNFKNKYIKYKLKYLKLKN